MKNKLLSKMYLALGVGALSLILYMKNQGSSVVLPSGIPLVESALDAPLPSQKIDYNKSVGGIPNDLFLQNRYNPPGPINPYELNNPLILSNAQPTLVNTQVSANNNLMQPASSQTPHTFSGQLPSVIAVQESLLPLTYGTSAILNPASAVTPTSYNYDTPVKVGIIGPDTYPQPQYLLGTRVKVNSRAISSSSY